jgi:hypothetical protein
VEEMSGEYNFCLTGEVSRHLLAPDETKRGQGNEIRSRR